MDFAIVDSHIHFWDTARFPYAWLKEAAAINHPYLPEDLVHAVADQQLSHIVFVQAGLSAEHALAEASWVSELAQNEPRIRGIVADAPLEQGSQVQAHLEALQRFPLVKGVRRLIQNETLGFARQADFVHAVKLLPHYGYSFDICIYHPQLPDILYLVERCPEVSFVLDHIGKPDIKGAIMDPWAEHIEALAAFPNVHCKFSGMVTEADHDNWRLDDLRPYAEHVLSCFGPKRLMYGGDWPVSELASDWQGWFQTAATLLEAQPLEDKKRIFHQNAIDFYRLS